jgi:hypothetical protein
LGERHGGRPTFCGLKPLIARLAINAEAAFVWVKLNSHSAFSSCYRSMGVGVINDFASNQIPDVWIKFNWLERYEVHEGTSISPKTRAS